MKMFKTLFVGFLVSVSFTLLESNTVCQKKTKTKPVAEQTRTNNLSRSVAAEMIKNHSDFKSTREQDVPVGRFWYDWRDIKEYFKALQPLEERGLLTFGATGKKNGWWNEYFVELTPDGEKEAKSWRKTSHKSPQWNLLAYYGPASPGCVMYAFPVEEKRLLAITGILFGIANKSAGVEYTWSWVVTDKGKSLLGRIQSDEIQRGKTSFQLYDDGWRVVSEERFPDFAPR